MNILRWILYAITVVLVLSGMVFVANIQHEQHQMEQPDYELRQQLRDQG